MRRKKQRAIEDEGASILLFVALAPVICSAGVLDPWQWARSDRIEVNIPWLPCNYTYLYIFETSIFAIYRILLLF